MDKRGTVKNATTSLVTFDFEFIIYEGAGCLVDIKDGNYTYEFVYIGRQEDSLGPMFLRATLDHPITNLQEIGPKFDYGTTFNSDVLEYLVDSNNSFLLESAKKIEGFEVLGYKYQTASNYRYGEPWASVEDAIEIYKQEQQGNMSLK